MFARVEVMKLKNEPPCNGAQEEVVRQNGKTYRMCLKAMEEASDGVHVWFESNTIGHLEHAMDVCAHLALIVRDDIRFMKSERSIRFLETAGGGMIHFHVHGEYSLSDYEKFTMGRRRTSWHKDI